MNVFFVKAMKSVPQFMTDFSVIVWRFLKLTKFLSIQATPQNLKTKPLMTLIMNFPNHSFF